jgi:adenylate cyclase
VPVQVSQYWTFKTSAGERPTLPIVAFQVFALQVYDDLIKLLGKYSPSQSGKLPHSKDEIIATGSMMKIISILRDYFKNNAQIAERMIEELQNSGSLSMEEREKLILTSLIKMYQSPNSLYLNYYGPPQTVNTVPYYKVLQLQDMSASNKDQLDFAGKAVFVGSSERWQTDQKDGFYTVFSQSSGLDISGVEIAATAFANILENMPVRQLYFRDLLAIILSFGLVMGIISFLIPPVISAVIVLGVSVLYLATALSLFKTNGIWFPLVIPLFLQAPMAFFGAIVMKYFDTNKERKNIRKAFSYYLPDEIVDQVSKNISNIEASNRVVYGTCLHTDAERYTSISETMELKELGSFINRYCETIFEPIKQHGGVVSNVIGDSMLALWVTVHPDAAQRTQACLAALDISDAVHRFNQASESVKLPTRIGLHSGQVLLGNVGAADHYEFRAVGDIVNTTTRIEGLNKYLGTRILVTEEVLNQQDGFLTRKLGKFLLVGKAKPLFMHELICRREASNEQQRSLCASFSEALDAFSRQSWEEATGKFNDLMNRCGKDGPSLFYLKLCNQYRAEPPGESWNGVVYIDKK